MTFILVERNSLFKYGNVIVNIGVLILFFNYFIDKEVYHLICTGFALIVAFIGIYIVGKNENGEQVGAIEFENDEILATVNGHNNKIPILNSTKIIFRKMGFKDQSNYIPFLTIGAFTSSPGINKISIFNNKEQFSYLILIESSKKMDWLTNYFKAMKANVKIKSRLSF